MGNKGSRLAVNNNGEKWRKENLVIDTIAGHFGNIIFAVDVVHFKGDPNQLLVASLGQDGRILLHLLRLSKKHKLKIEKCGLIHFNSSSNVALSLSPSSQSIAHGGMDNMCSVYQISNLSSDQSRVQAPDRELRAHDGYVGRIKFINDGCLLSASGDGTVIVWDIEAARCIKRFDPGVGDIIALDYIRLNGCHIVAFGGISSPEIVIIDISEHLPDTLKPDKDDEKQRQYKQLNTEYKLTSNFQADINSVAFSDTGQFLAATSDDGTYEIYKIVEQMDTESNVCKFHWEHFYSRSLRSVHAEACGTSVTWSDPVTLMVAQDASSLLFVTQMVPMADNIQVRNAIKSGIQANVGNAWSGLVDDIVLLVLSHLDEYEINDYTLDPQPTIYRMSSLASCSFGDKRQHHCVVAGSWNKSVTCLVSVGEISK